MFAMPFGRIFWKEYRVQRALWMSCLFIGILFQLTLWWSVYEPHLRGVFLLGGASFFPVMYAVGCGALLFASEREDRTCDWLITLSIPPAPTLSAKFTIAVVSTVALQLVLALFTFIFFAGTPSENLLKMLVPFALPVLAWSSLGSLLSRRVLTSVPAMAFWCIFPNILVLCLLGRIQSRITEWDVRVWQYVVILSFCVLGVDIWLGWRWCQGKYIDGAILEGLSVRSITWWNKLTHRESARWRVSTRTEYEQPWRRTWQRLVWQERRRESFPRLLTVAGCLLGLLIGLVTPFGPDLLGWLLFSLVALGALTPLAMGVFGFRADSHMQQPRFLAYRGIAPGSLWLAKQAVWLTRAFWVPSVLFSCALFFLLTFGWMAGSLPTLQIQNADPLFKFHLVVWFVLLSYGCGQLAALSFQRTVLAIAFGGFLTIVVALWILLIEYLAVPQWWSLGFPVVAMLLITLWQVRPWLFEDHSWLRRCKVCAVLIAMPVTLIAMLAVHRVSEVNLASTFDPSIVNHSLANARSSLRPLSSDEEFVRLRLEVLSQADHDTSDEIVNLLKRDLFSLERVADLKRSADDRNLGYPPKVNTILTKKGNDFLLAGELDKAFECHLTQLKLARLTLSRRAFLGWLQGSQFQRWTLEKVVDWANHPAQTPASIRNAAKTLEAELAKFPSATEGIAASYHSDRQMWILSAGTEVVEELTRLKGFDNGDLWHELIFALLPWELTRADLLMTHEAELRFAAIWSLETRLSSPKTAAKRSVTKDFSAIEARNESLARTTPIARFSSFPLNPLMNSVLDRHTNIRAAVTRMELIAYRLEQGKLPDRLVQLMPTIDGVNLVDPWSGRLFEYYSTFLLSPGNYGIDLIPVNATEVEFHSEGYINHNDGRCNFSQITSGTPEEISSRLAELRKDGVLMTSLFQIPLPTKSDPQP